MTSCRDATGMMVTLSVALKEDLWLKPCFLLPGLVGFYEGFPSKQVPGSANLCSMALHPQFPAM